MEAPKVNICAMCLGSMKAGDGRALFTAQCSHIFHFNCITSSVQHGNHICPICRSTWTDLPSQVLPGPYFNYQQPLFNPPNFNFNVRPAPFFSSQPPTLTNSDDFADDEPLPTPVSEPDYEASSTTSSNPAQGDSITVKALPEYAALSRSERSESFAVLVGVRAPPLSPEATDRPGTRAPLDLVAVLDVSGSMDGGKIRLLKEAVNFVVDNLGPADRFSIITFSTVAQRVTPLRRMTDMGKTEMAQAVNSLRASGATNIIAGLRKAVQVLEQRREKNPVASIILLSDGQDNQNGHSPADFLRALNSLPPSIRSRDSSANQTHTEAVPVHTFGFGSDHDAEALHLIADKSGGTFSYIESIHVIQDAFAQCLGGLLSVVAQEVEIRVQSGSDGVQIQSIISGRYRNTVDNDARKHGVIYVGDLYAEEEKKFLVYLSVPQETDSATTKLLEVMCSHKDPLLSYTILSETKTVEISRPSTEALTASDRQVCLEVDRERNRVLVAEGIAQAQAMADRGELQEARSLLTDRRQRILTSFSAQAGDSQCVWLESEVREVHDRMTSRGQYQSGGRAYALSKGSSHMSQRAATQAIQLQSHQQSQCFSFGSSMAAPPPPPPEGAGYQTSFMKKMVTKSQQLRQSGGSDDTSKP